MLLGVSWLRALGLYKRTQAKASLLPPEIVLLIVPDLSLPDLFSFAMTCRHFQYICLPLYLQRCDAIDIYSKTLLLQPSSFCAALSALASSQLLNGLNYEELHCYFPSCPLDAETAITHFYTLKSILLRLEAVNTLNINIDIASPARSRATSPLGLAANYRWQTALLALLHLATDKSRSLHVCFHPYHIVSPVRGLISNLRPRSFPSKDSTLEALSINNLGLLLHATTLDWASVASVTTLKLSGGFRMSPAELPQISLPNLIHLEMEGYELHPLEPWLSFLSRYPNLVSLRLDLGLSLHLSRIWPQDQLEVLPHMLPNVTSLYADVATALWLLGNTHALPTLQAVTVSGGFIDSQLTPTTHIHTLLWGRLAARSAETSLNGLVLRDTQIIARLLGVEVPAVPKYSLPSIRYLALEDGRLDAPDSYSLHAGILNALPAWLARLFPSLQNIDIRRLKLVVPTAVENEFTANMKTVCPGVKVEHNIDRLEHK